MLEELPHLRPTRAIVDDPSFEGKVSTFYWCAATLREKRMYWEARQASQINVTAL